MSTHAARTAAHRIDYDPPPTIKQFIKDYRPGELFYDWIVGPVGSGKTTGIFFKLCYMASLQAKGPDGIRRSRAVVVRNTMPQLRDTTIVSWSYWFKHGIAGEWKETTKTFVLRYGDVECEVLFRALDTPEDVARVLSLEVTFAIIDEFVQIPKEIVNALSARLGRYPSKKDGGATNWGMWGSSNPDTEDNWWYDYLHTNPAIERIPSIEELGLDARMATPEDIKTAYNAALEMIGQRPDCVGRYFKQPSGFSPWAENLDNLPGQRKYYTNQAKDKAEAWIKQFLEAEWGFSISGKPVVPTFKADLHLAKSPLRFNPNLPLLIGFDPGIGGSAMIFGQEDLEGRLLVMAELVQQGYGVERLVTQRLKPFLRNFFPDAQVIIAPDPAAANRAQTDERSVVDRLKKYYTVKYESNNRLPLRLEAIEHFTTRITPSGPALLIDASRCPLLVRALKGGWKYAIDTKKEIIKGAEPEKNHYSHVGDAFGYLARFFHRGSERDGPGAKKFIIPRSFGGSSYHHR